MGQNSKMGHNSKMDHGLWMGHNSKTGHGLWMGHDLNIGGRSAGKCLLALGLTCALSLGLVSCGQKAAAKTDTLKIGLTVYDDSDTFLSQITEEIRSRAKEDSGPMKITVSAKGADGSQRTQDEQVEELIASGCNILFVNLVDRTDPSNIIDLARDNNVPIIFYNRELVKEDLMQWDKLYYVGAKAGQSAELQGQEIAAYIAAHPEVDSNGDGKIQYVMLKGEPGHQDAIIRSEKVVETLLAEGVELDKLSYEVANWSRAQAENRTSQLISEYHGQIELLISNNDDMALGAMDAYDKSNMTQNGRPAIFGIDGTKETLEAIRAGKVQGTVMNDATGQADAMMDLAEQIFQGKDLSKLPLLNGKYIYIDYTIPQEN